MRHAFVDIGDKTMCSRCGNLVQRTDEECPAISDTAKSLTTQLSQALAERDAAREALEIIQAENSRAKRQFVNVSNKLIDEAIARALGVKET
jgi:hypothetical protein